MGLCKLSSFPGEVSVCSWLWNMERKVVDLFFSSALISMAGAGRGQMILPPLLLPPGMFDHVWSRFCFSQLGRCCWHQSKMPEVSHGETCSSGTLLGLGT